MALHPYENLKGFAHSKPPLMVFLVCLGFFAVVLMSLAYYVKLSEHIPNPDISQDWNAFLHRFTQLEFCIQPNVTDGVTSTTLAPSSLLDNFTTEYDFSRNYSVSMQISVIPTLDFIRIPHNMTHVTGTFQGELLGLVGGAATEEINITMDLPYEWNNTRCSAASGCQEIKFFTCVHFQANADIFPATMSPETCECVNENDTGIEYYTTLFTQKKSDRYLNYLCHHRPVLKMKHQPDKQLTVFLSVPDRSVINLHLMHTSYFLFVMVVTVLGYAIIRGRPLKSVVTQTESLLSSSSTTA